MVVEKFFDQQRYRYFPPLFHSYLLTIYGNNHLYYVFQFTHFKLFKTYQQQFVHNVSGLLITR
ncbi:MAG TPA: hypothetical protein DCR43_04165 [Bacteroidales bacterium]|nr:MAG: hypothetical protein A2X11_01345 [Bacteroidetes bacterium GWE2_42_24]HAQ65036.1 hypothetical protein [Bacteroidales bacterium]HBZ65912.1 hypothetical protein [Bacteroidales bacterium]